MLGFSPLADNSIAGFGNAPSDAAVTGVVGTGAVGSVTIAGFSDVTVTGVAATGAIGSVTVDTNINVSVTGIAATGAIGSVNIWDFIIPNQTSGFSAITPSQSPSWDDIAA